MDRLGTVDDGLVAAIEELPSDAARRDRALAIVRSVTARLDVQDEPAVAGVLTGSADEAALNALVERLDEQAWERRDAGDDDSYLEIFSRARAANAALEYASGGADGNLADVAYEAYGATGDVAFLLGLLRAS